MVRFCSADHISKGPKFLELLCSWQSSWLVTASPVDCSIRVYWPVVYIASQVQFVIFDTVPSKPMEFGEQSGNFGSGGFVSFYLKSLEQSLS